MNIREISDVFKDTAADITALKSYNFGWASDRVRQGNTEDFQELNAFPRVFFSVPTITASDQTRKQDTYQVTLFFDDLLGYDNDGDADLTLQIDKWAALQQYATAFIQRLNLIKQTILPNYLFIPEPPQFTFDSFVGIQRLVTVQVNFNLVVPTNCEVTVQRIINVVGNVIAQGIATGNIFLSTSVSALIECTATATGAIVSGQQNVIEVESNVTAFALASGDIVTVKTVAANVVSTATVNAEVQRAVNVIGQLNATGQVSGDISLTLFATGSADARATVDANLQVTTQGVTECEANVTGTGVINGSLFVIRTLEAQSIGQATSQSEIILSKLLSASVIGSGVSEGSLQLGLKVNANIEARATSEASLEVTTQNVTTFDAYVIATATSEASIQRIISVESSVNTIVTTSAEAKLTRVLDASATATAQTSSDAQITIPINAKATATAVTSAYAQLSYTVNASATATAETSAEAFITRIISASATATANSSAEAGIGVTFVAAAVATATSSNATLSRTATIAASVTGQVTVTGATLTTADNVAASVSAAATVTNATLNVAAPLLLDLYPSATAAYSLRKLRTAYSGNAIRVRRSSDNTEQNIGFDSNGNLNESALTTFVGSGNGFIVTWYDQSTNAINTIQATQSSQPQIVSSGSILRTNGKPSVLFDGTNDFLATTGTPFSATENTLIAVSKQNAVVASYRRIFCVGLYNSGRYLGSNISSDDILPIFNNLILTDFGGVAISQNISIMYNNGTNGILWQNGLQILTKVASNVSYGNQNIFLGWDSAQLINEAWNGIGQEFIFYPTSQSSNVNQIGTNINTYYGIY